MLLFKDLKKNKGSFWGQRGPPSWNLVTPSDQLNYKKYKNVACPITRYYNKDINADFGVNRINSLGARAASVRNGKNTALLPAEAATQMILLNFKLNVK